MREKLLIIYGAYLVVLSLITFIAYWLDKKKAQRGKRRTPEKVLLLMSFLGGAFGGFSAMKIARHKTTMEHWYFTAVNVFSILIHLALMICIAFVIKF